MVIPTIPPSLIPLVDGLASAGRPLCILSGVINLTGSIFTLHPSFTFINGVIFLLPSLLELTLELDRDNLKNNVTLIFLFCVVAASALFIETTIYPNFDSLLMGVWTVVKTALPIISVLYSYFNSLSFNITLRLNTTPMNISLNKWVYISEIFNTESILQGAEPETIVREVIFNPRG